MKCATCGQLFLSQEAVLSHIQSFHNLSAADAKFVSVSATTWSKDSHSLFDREAVDQHTRQTLIVPLSASPTSSTYDFYRDAEGDVHATPGFGPHESLHTRLTLSRSCKEALVDQSPVNARRVERDAERSKMWFPVGNEGYALREADVIKIGRFKLTVQQLVLEGPAEIPDYTAIHDERPLVEATQADLHCRICLGTAQETNIETDGPLLLAPCLCKGGSQAVHLVCLQTWLQQKYQVKNDRNRFISCKPPGCEVCKAAYPSSLQRPEGSVALHSAVPALNPPFLVLMIPKGAGEARDRPHGERFIFAPADSGAKLRIGRSSTCELRVNDVSVSRVHATVTFQDGSFLLWDEGSKFQTCVHPRGPMVLPGTGARTVDVQAGRTVLSFAMIAPELLEEQLSSRIRNSECEQDAISPASFQTCEESPALAHAEQETLPAGVADGDDSTLDRNACSLH